MTKKCNKKGIYICFGIVIFVFCVGIFFEYQRRQPLPFSTEKWINEDDTKRYRMLDDFTRNYDLIGMSADEVEILLGEYSIRCDAFPSDAGKIDCYWGYIIRHDAWEGKEVLLIGLQNGMVVNYERAHLSEL